MNKSFSIDQKKLFETKYIFIDGISRAGKAGITPIVSSFENVEHILKKKISKRMTLVRIILLMFMKQKMKYLKSLENWT